MSKRTSKFKLCKNIFHLLSFLSTYGVFIVFLIIAFIQGGPSTGYTFGVIALASAVIMLISILAKQHWLTPLILLTAGIIYCLDMMMVPLIVIGVSIILDELCFRPLYNYFKNRYVINKEIDINNENLYHNIVESRQ